MATATGSSTKTSLQQVLDVSPMGRTRWLIVVLAFLTIAFDGLDIALGGFVLPQIVTEWGTSIAMVTTIVTLGTIGMALGATLAGPLADRRGRKAVILGGVAIFGLGTLCAAFSPNAEVLMVFRFITCFGLGATMPATVTLVAEFVPSARRSFFVASTFSGFAVGTLVGGYLARAVVPSYGWQGLLIIGGLGPLLLLILLAWKVPESVVFLASKGRSLDAVRRTVTRIAPHQALSVIDFTSPPARLPSKGSGPIRIVLSRLYLARTLLLWLCYFICLAVTYLLLNYLPLVIKEFGLSVASAGLVVAMLGWGGVTGGLLIGALMGRLGRFRTVALFFGLGSLSVWAAAIFTLDLNGLMILGFCWGLLILTINPGMNALAAIAYPVEARATGVAWMHAIGRTGTITSGVLGGVMVGLGWSLSQIFFVLGFPLVLGVLAVSALSVITSRSERSGRRPIVPAVVVRDSLPDGQQANA